MVKHSLSQSSKCRLDLGRNRKERKKTNKQKLTFLLLYSRFWSDENKMFLTKYFKLKLYSWNSVEFISGSAPGSSPFWWNSEKRSVSDYRKGFYRLKLIYHLDCSRILVWTNLRYEEFLPFLTEYMVGFLSTFRGILILASLAVSFCQAVSVSECAEAYVAC